MHVWPPDRVSSVIKTAKMANGSSCEINDIPDVYIVDKLGTKICLGNAHSVKGVEKHIISINALRKDGWKLMDNGNVKIAYLVKDDCRVTFIEKDNNLHYLQAIEASVDVSNIVISTPRKLPAILLREANGNVAEVTDNEDNNENKRPKINFTANKASTKGYDVKYSQLGVVKKSTLSNFSFPIFLNNKVIYYILNS